MAASVLTSHVFGPAKLIFDAGGTEPAKFNIRTDPFAIWTDPFANTCISIYNQGLLSRVLGGVPAYPTGCRPFGKVPWTLQSLVLRPLLPRCRLEPKRAGNYTHTASQSDPRVTQMPMGESSKTYGIYSVRATLSHCGRSWTRTCVCVFFRRLLSEISGDFWRLGGHIGAQDGVLFSSL